jgi:hypothetical protein
MEKASGRKTVRRTMSENEGIVTPNPKYRKEGPLRGFFNICTKFDVRISSKTPNLAILTIWSGKCKYCDKV